MAAHLTSTRPVKPAVQENARGPGAALFFPSFDVRIF
uniref:Uncharacterized protein n=1 Tax=Anguilla anguilla TaxID=7936 RepID=A0A0E9TP76_ANGAN